jgi:hypothetical protein
VITYDADSNPVTQDWGKAMLEVMLGRSELNSISLLHNAIAIRPWEESVTKGHKIVTLPHPEMFNVTMWRAQAVMEGLKGWGYYGHVERSIWQPGKNAFLHDFREDFCPIQPLPIYVEWKVKHAFEGFEGNFHEYLALFAPHLLS